MTTAYMQKATPYLALLVLSACMVALPTLRINPVNINSDVFQYLSLANYYLYFDATQVRDAFTVGPVIPALLFCLKWFALKWFSWSAQLDITLICLVSYLSYSAIVMSLLFISQKRGVPTVIGVLLATLFLFFLPWDSEALSPNGELVSSAFICTALACYFGASTFTYKRLIAIALLLLAAFFTKVQSLPILFLCIYCFGMPAKSKGQLIAIGLLIGAIIEGFLYTHGGGLIYHFGELASYTSGQSMGKMEYAKQVFSRLAWIVDGTVRFFPLLLWIALAQLFLGVNKQHSSNPTSFRFSLFWVWYGICFLTAFLPNRFFPHYFLFFIPLVVLFSADSAARLLQLTSDTTHSAKHYALIWVAIFALAILKMVQVLPMQQSLLSGKTFYTPFILSPQTEKVQTLLNTKGDNFYVHGWDYRYYGYLNKGFAGEPHLYSVQQHFQTPQAYLNDLLKLAPQYILDVVEHSGFIRGVNWRLTQHEAWAKTFVQCYNPIYDEAGLRLYERKSPLPSDCQPPAVSPNKP
jgi:hypothetical protein